MILLRLRRTFAERRSRSGCRRPALRREASEHTVRFLKVRFLESAHRTTEPNCHRYQHGTLRGCAGHTPDLATLGIVARINTPEVHDDWRSLCSPQSRAARSVGRVLTPGYIRAPTGRFAGGLCRRP